MSENRASGQSRDRVRGAAAVDVGDDTAENTSDSRQRDRDRAAHSARAHDQGAAPRQPEVVASTPPAPRSRRERGEHARRRGGCSENTTTNVDSALIAGETPNLSSPKM